MSEFGHDACICPAGPCPSCAAAPQRAAQRAHRQRQVLIAAGLGVGAAILLLGFAFSGPGGIEADPAFAAFERSAIHVN